MENGRQREWEDELQDLPGYSTYKEFNSIENTTNDNGICKRYNISDKEALKFCQKATSIVRHLPSIEDDAARKDRCYYFQHWFYDQIRRKFNNSGKNISSTTNASNLFKVLKEINSKEMKGKPCACYDTAEAYDVKEEKDLHDYFKNHANFDCKNKNKYKCQKYYYYITYINGLYEKYIDESGDYSCCYAGSVEDECRSYFNCDDTFNPKHLLPKLESELERLNEVTVSEVSTVETLVRETPVGPLALQDTISDSDNEQEHTLTTFDTFYEDSNFTSTIGNVYNTLNSNYFRRIIAVVSIVGTALFLYFYYRVTKNYIVSHKHFPLICKFIYTTHIGSGFNKKKLKKKKPFYSNSVTYHDELSEYNPKSKYLNDEMYKLHLAYNTIQDSFS
ncbi:variable surface protein [Plasmodium gonderi]|uniref:Variable surface protein n=1 Tax=Plasmodium gonderi TaxID=77519 RepID=A0A1Y1JW69_PLAGO|nr:variable surface protein [Plasmodium gonderi]GAW84593.1 variable surface protein [Plasmodium gonderi]